MEFAPEHRAPGEKAPGDSSSEDARASQSDMTAGIDAKILLGASATLDSATPGGFLRQERERQGRSLQQVADELHLSRQAIEAIEGNRFAEFGAPVFAKGHLRRYAIFLHATVDDIFARYEQLSDAARATETAQRAAHPHESVRRVALTREASGLRIAPRTHGSKRRWVLIALLAIVIGLASIAMWRWNTYRVAEQPAPQASVSGPQPAEVQAIVAPPPVAAAMTTDAQPIVQPPPPATAAVETREPSPTSPLPGKVRLKLTFKQDSWAEVYDGRGNRMMYDVGRADLPRVIDADPPVQVVLGYAPAVDVEINGAGKNVPERRINNSVARFAVQADGSIQ